MNYDSAKDFPKFYLAYFCLYFLYALNNRPTIYFSYIYEIDELTETHTNKNIRQCHVISIN